VDLFNNYKMDDEYELVSKEYVENLKKENLELKNKLKDLQSSVVIDKNINSNSKKTEDRFSEVIFAIQEEAKKERELVLKELENIKELNEKSLTTTLSKSDDLEIRLEKMVDGMKEMVDSLSTIVDEIKTQDSSKYELLAEKISTQINNDLKVDGEVASIAKKLEDIDLFMKNLRVLLSYVKPAKMVMDKKS